MRKIKRVTALKTIHKRLYRLASLICREKANFTCEICGLKAGDIYKKTGKKQRVEAHHVMSRSNKNSPLKYDLRNLVCLCTNHHKTDKKSAHKHGLWFAKWFLEKRPDDAKWILEHTDDIVDLDDRDILKSIEENLIKNQIEQKNCSEKID